MGDKAFNGCSSVESLTLPSSITSIGTSAFEGCTGRVTINCRIYGASSYSDGKFYKAKFSEVIIGNSVTRIGDNAFHDCSSLTSVTIGNRVTEIGNFAFRSCSSLTNVTIPDSVTKIEDCAFEHCYSLT
ncbi:MAG: leucine-rich repeat domain-containing protein, partial [Alistipes sp.]|nr:leucine-rich repeat domain-containing protein [Alistipes sp.]